MRAFAKIVSQEEYAGEFSERAAQESFKEGSPRELPNVLFQESCPPMVWFRSGCQELRPLATAMRALGPHIYVYIYIYRRSNHMTCRLDRL